LGDAFHRDVPIRLAGVFREHFRRLLREAAMPARRSTVGRDGEELDRLVVNLDIFGDAGGRGRIAHRSTNRVRHLLFGKVRGGEPIAATVNAP